jgi:epoxyqueuosine reductase QueG
LSIKAKITNYINDFLNTEINTMPETGEKLWDEPLTGFSDGNDPLYQKYKEMIGEFYWTPEDVMKLCYKDSALDTSKIAVVTWIMPQTPETIKEQNQNSELPAVRWMKSRHYGEELNHALRRGLQDFCRKAGYKCVSPVIMQEWDYRNSDREGICSNWSERHAAYVAGLGTFSLSDGFITDKGMAMRCGSMVIEAEIEPDKRIYTSHTQNCLFLQDGKCGACIKRCPVGAISENGHDKEKCKQYTRSVTSLATEKAIGHKVNACGLCQTKIPCAKTNPRKKYLEQ